MHSGVPVESSELKDEHDSEGLPDQETLQDIFAVCRKRERVDWLIQDILEHPQTTQEQEVFDRLEDMLRGHNLSWAMAAEPFGGDISTESSHQQLGEILNRLVDTVTRKVGILPRTADTDEEMRAVRDRLVQTMGQVLEKISGNQQSKSHQGDQLHAAPPVHRNLSESSPDPRPSHSDNAA